MSTNYKTTLAGLGLGCIILLLVPTVMYVTDPSFRGVFVLEEDQVVVEFQPIVIRELGRTNNPDCFIFHVVGSDNLKEIAKVIGNAFELNLEEIEPYAKDSGSGPGGQISYSGSEHPFLRATIDATGKHVTFIENEESEFNADDLRRIGQQFRDL